VKRRFHIGLCSCLAASSFIGLSDNLGTVRAETIEEAFKNALTEKQYVDQLHEKFGISAPIYLGCNRDAILTVSLPLNCEYAGIGIVLEDLGDPGLDFKSLIQSIGASSMWQRTSDLSQDAQQRFALLDWDLDQVSVWSYSRDSSSLICATGNPWPYQRAAVPPVFEVGKCYLAFASSTAPNRVIRLTFLDHGEWQIFETYARTDSVYLQTLMSFFSLQVYALT
jgi:hypothetical protein